jgi:hypothetical protein
MIREKFDVKSANRNIVASKLEWYKRHRNHEAYCKSYLVKLKKYTPDFKSEIIPINEFIWETFINITNKKLLNKVIPYGRKAVNLATSFPELLDSYANLLYKAGKRKDAIVWEQRAVDVSSGDAEMKVTLSQMKNSEPTYQHQGAIWK